MERSSRELYGSDKPGGELYHPLRSDSGECRGVTEDSHPYSSKRRRMVPLPNTGEYPRDRNGASCYLNSEHSSRKPDSHLLFQQFSPRCFYGRLLKHALLVGSPPFIPQPIAASVVSRLIHPKLISLPVFSAEALLEDRALIEPTTANVIHCQGVVSHSAIPVL